MSIVNSGISAVTKLVVFAVLVAAFLFGLASVVYMSLQGSEVKVPEVVGKNFGDSEKELASLGLKIKRRAERPSADAPNTVLEQLPRPGETVKTGQLILVVTSRSSGGEETPSTLKKSLEEDDTEKIEEMISDKPKKAKSNSNTSKKKAETTRDVLGNTATSTMNSDTTSDGSSEKKESGSNNNSDKGKETVAPQTKPATPSSAKPPATKPGGTDRPGTPSKP